MSFRGGLDERGDGRMEALRWPEKESAPAADVIEPRRDNWIFATVFHIQACLVRKIFQDSTSHRILRHMYGALNIHKSKNYLHSSSVNREMNFLILVTL